MRVDHSENGLVSPASRLARLRRSLRRLADAAGHVGVVVGLARPRGGPRRAAVADFIFGAFEHRAEAAMALAELALALEQFADLGFHQLLVEQLAAGDAVDLRAQCRDAVLIGLLHARLPGGGGADQIVAQHQIGGRQR